MSADLHVLRLFVGGLAIAVVATIALMVIGFVQLAHTSAAQHHDEQTACAIQSRGLPAGKELALGIDGLHQLLSLKPTAATKARNAKEIPAAELKRERALVAYTNAHLAHYQALESKQPAHRAC